MTTTPAVVSVQSLMTDVGTIVTQAITWVGSYAGAITSNAIIEIFVIVAFVGLGVGLIKRMIRL